MNNLIVSITIFIVINSILIISFFNAIFSLLILVVNFILSSFILWLLSCEFLALMFLIVYIGAIMVLFLFLLMLLDIKFKNLSRILVNNKLIQFLSVLLLLFSINFITIKNQSLFHSYYTIELANFINWGFLFNSNYNVDVYSMLLYGNFMLEFLITGFVLLLVLVGIIFIINNYLNLNIKYSTSVKQISIRSKFFY